MADGLSPVNSTGALAAVTATSAATPAAASGFTKSLEKVLNAVEQSATTANAAVDDMLTGKGDVPEAMIALQKADVALQLTVQVRNKLVQAYQEIMRMPV